MKQQLTGFTLIELIIVIVIFGIVAAMLVPFMGSALVDSHNPIDNLMDASDLSSEMAKVIAKYREDNDVGQIKSNLISMVDTNEVSIVHNDYVKFTASGQGYVEQPGNSTDSSVLKVILASKKNSGEKLIYYFTE